MIDVVAAVFCRGDRFLACRRKRGLASAGQWEFPGGKREPTESMQAALKREISEELGVSIEVGRSLGSNRCDTGDRVIDLHCYLVTEWRGAFEPTDHDKLQWLLLEELQTVGLSAADVPFVDRLAFGKS